MWAFKYSWPRLQRGICIEDGRPVQRDTAALSAPPVLFARCLDRIEDGGVPFLSGAAIGTEEIFLVRFESGSNSHSIQGVGSSYISSRLRYMGGNGLLVEEFHRDRLALEVLLVEPPVSPVVVFMRPVLQRCDKAKPWCALVPVAHDLPPGLRFRRHRHPILEQDGDVGDAQTGLWHRSSRGPPVPHMRRGRSQGGDTVRSCRRQLRQ